MKRYQHDCNQCHFLGQEGKYDLYVCSHKGMEIDTVIARYGDSGPDYSSGYEIAIRMGEHEAIHHPLFIAFHRAITAGFRPPKED